MFKFEYNDIGWWYWLVTAGFLTYGLSGNTVGFILAIGLTVLQLFHFMIREKSIKAFPVQVRFWYLMLLIVSLPAVLQWVFWIPAIGTWAQVIFGYCAMARCVALLPWNRGEPFSAALIRKTFLSPPVRGNIQQGFAGDS